MKKLFHALIATGALIFFAGGLVFVLGQLIFLIIGQPEMMIKIEEIISKIIFPAISITGLLCFVYGYCYPKKKK